VELNFPKGVHPSSMTTEEAKAYWAFYTGEKQFEPLPKDGDDYEE